MTLISIDSETHLIKKGCVTPKLVCVTADYGSGSEIYNADDGTDLFEHCLQDPDTHITGQNFFFDMAVFAAHRPSLLRLIFDEIDAGRIHCTMIRDMIIANLKGDLKFIENELGELKPAKFGLAEIAWRRLKIKVNKGKDTWRLRYNELDGVPFSEWPEAALTYAKNDATLTYDVFMSQEAECSPEGITGELGQTQAAWALYLMGAWGVRTDPDAVAKFRDAVNGDYAVQEALCVKNGFVRPTGVMNTKVVKAEIKKWFLAQGLKVPTTEKGNIKTDRDTLSQVKGDLVAVAERGRLRKLKTTYLPTLEKGVEVPVNASYNTMVETFRTSCRQPNCQNPPRKGGFRECFIPRLGWLYIFCDYATLEMRTLAQVCLDLFGWSFMADALRAGKDLHLMVASEMLDISYNEAVVRLAAGDDIVKANRSAAKPANFGFPGGMGPKAFVEFSWKSYGVRVTLDKAKQLKDTFMRMWPEMKEYFKYCSGQLDRVGNRAQVIKGFRSGVCRGQVKYTATCNFYFQNLAAMGAKEALVNVARECYLNETPELAGCRPVFFLHDEIGMETPYAHDYAKASAAAERLSTVMETTMRKWVPDIETPAEPVLMRRWYKGAEPVRKKGILVPCRPVKQGKKTIWVED